LQNNTVKLDKTAEEEESAKKKQIVKRSDRIKKRY
jgi:hypothetical protein